VLPESLPADRRAPIDWRRANPIGSIGLLRSHRTLLALATAAFLYRIGHDAMPSLFVIFVEHRFGWNERTIGFVLAIIGVVSMIVQAGLVSTAVKRLGERRAMQTGFAFGVLSFLIYALAPTGAIFLIGIPVGALFGFAYPALQGLMTRRVAPEEQGRLQGALASLMGIAGVIAPFLFTQIFAEAIGRYRGLNLPGAPFFVAAALLVVAMIAGRAAREEPADVPISVREPVS
jgi:DHA1 family tetracycline resistance protein-like MFS transporter